MLPDRFGELKADGQDRIERCHRLLKDHADLTAADLADFLFAQRQKIAAVEPDAATDDTARRRRNEAQNRERTDRLAAAGLADHRNGLALPDIIRDAVDGSDEPRRRLEMSPQVLYLEQICHTIP